MYNLYKRPKDTPKHRRFGDTDYRLMEESFSKQALEKIKKNMKMADPKVKVRIVRRQWDLRGLYSLYAYGEI